MRVLYVGSRGDNPGNVERYAGLLGHYCVGSVTVNFSDGSTLDILSGMHYDAVLFGNPTVPDILPFGQAMVKRMGARVVALALEGERSDLRGLGAIVFKVPVEPVKIARAILGDKFKEPPEKKD